MTLYLVACVDRTRMSDDVVWWKPNSCGYTTDLKQAGRFGLDAARRICAPQGGVVKHLMFEEGEIAEECKSVVVNRDSLRFMELFRERQGTDQ